MQMYRLVPQTKGELPLSDDSSMFTSHLDCVCSMLEDDVKGCMYRID